MVWRTGVLFMLYDFRNRLHVHARWAWSMDYLGQRPQ